jgi:hypothetical protein
MRYDKVIIGAGIYGLYAAIVSARKGQRVLVLEYESDLFQRATYVNQARVHMGYHYPRSISTALKSRNYFERFTQDYNDAIKYDFTSIYATSKKLSWTNAEQFKLFCKNADIPCEDIMIEKYFNEGYVDGAFLTEEYTYDAEKLKNLLLNDIETLPNIDIRYNTRIASISEQDSSYHIQTKDNQIHETPFLLNATYASINQIQALMDLEPLDIKYELCEIILCKVSENLRGIGITVMDGPFFSIMPFGDTGYHALTSVTYTPHLTSHQTLPTFDCQSRSEGTCSPKQLGNCNTCVAKPKSAWPYMSTLAMKYLNESYQISHVKSLFSIKPILMKSEIDDSRPTLIRTFSTNPTYVSVLSGKINTIYDLDEVLA